MNIFAAFPSYRSISREEAGERCAEAALVHAGHGVGVAVLGGYALLDKARAELTAAFRHNKPFSVMLAQDDDVSIEAASLLKMITLLETRKDVDVLSAPCKLRSEGHAYNIVPTSAPDADRLVECLWTGLGCVLVRRSAVDRLYEAFPRLWYPAEIVPASGCAVYSSLVVDARELDGSSPEGVGTFLGDDRVWSYRLGRAGVTIHAFVDARTNHRGFEGCFGESLRLADDAAVAEGRAPVEAGPRLVGADGKTPLR